MTKKFTRLERPTKSSIRKIRSCGNSSKAFPIRKKPSYEQIATRVEGRLVCFHRPGAAGGFVAPVQQRNHILPEDLQNPAPCQQCRRLKSPGRRADVRRPGWHRLGYSPRAEWQDRDHDAQNLQ